MILYMLVLTVFVLAALLTPERVGQPNSIRALQLLLKPYSGLNPDLYTKYINNMELFEENINFTDSAKDYLYNAIDNAEDLKLYGDVDFSDTILVVAKEGERILFEHALKNGDHFYPKYGGSEDRVQNKIR